MSDKDDSGSVTAGDVNLIDTRNSPIKADATLVALKGLDDVVVSTIKDAP